MLSFTGSDSVLTVINLIVLYLILRKFLFHPVTNMIESRQAEIEESLQNAEVTNQNAEKTLSAYKEQLSQVESEAAQLLSTAKEEAKAQSHVILEHAHLQATKLTETTKAELSREREELFSELQNEVADLALLTAKRISNPEEEKDHKTDFVSSFLKQAGDLT